MDRLAIGSNQRINMKRIETVWITKYALTQGILVYHNVDLNEDGTMVSVNRLGHMSLCFHIEGRDWHRTEVAAFARCFKIRDARVKSLEKELDKLEDIRFEVKEGI